MDKYCNLFLSRTYVSLSFKQGISIFYYSYGFGLSTAHAAGSIKDPQPSGKEEIRPDEEQASSKRKDPDTPSSDSIAKKLKGKEEEEAPKEILNPIPSLKPLSRAETTALLSRADQGMRKLSVK